jgi:hypothetical protein
VVVLGERLTRELDDAACVHEYSGERSPRADAAIGVHGVNMGFGADRAISRERDLLAVGRPGCGSKLQGKWVSWRSRWPVGLTVNS